MFLYSIDNIDIDTALIVLDPVTQRSGCLAGIYLMGYVYASFLHSEFLLCFVDSIIADGYSLYLLPVNFLLSIRSLSIYLYLITASNTAGTSKKAFVTISFGIAVRTRLFLLIHKR